jgi:hypothetical protein
MGYYTEIYINVDLKDTVPEDVINVLKVMCDHEDADLEALTEEQQSWRYLFYSASYYTPNTACRLLTKDEYCYSLLGKGDTKYSGFIKDFFEWIMPYIDGNQGDFIGYKRGEDDQIPTLIFLNPDQCNS